MIKLGDANMTKVDLTDEVWELGENLESVFEYIHTRKGILDYGSSERSISVIRFLQLTTWIASSTGSAFI